MVLVYLLVETVPPSLYTVCIAAMLLRTARFICIIYVEICVPAQGYLQYSHLLLPQPCPCPCHVPYLKKLIFLV